MKKLIIRPDGIEEVNLTAEEISQAETNDANSQLKLQQEEHSTPSPKGPLGKNVPR